MVPGPRGLSSSSPEACDSLGKRDLGDRLGLASRSSVCGRAMFIAMLMKSNGGAAPIGASSLAHHR